MMKLDFGNGYSPRGFATTSYLSKASLIDLVSKAYADCFDHRAWSIDDAEKLERLARSIREGYAQGSTTR